MAQSALYGWDLPALGDAANIETAVGGLVQAMEGASNRVTVSNRGSYSAIPAYGKWGQRYYATDQGQEYLDTGSGWVPVNAITKTWQETKTFPIQGAVGTEALPSFSIGKSSGQTVQLVRLVHRLDAGSANITIQRAAYGGSFTNVAGLTSLAINATDQTVTPTPITLADRDKLKLVVNSVSGAQNLSVAFIFEHSI